MAQTKAIVNKLLTNVSNGIFPVGYIADKAFNTITVKQSTGLLGNYGLGHLRVSNDLMGGRAQARRADPITRGLLPYEIRNHGLEGVVTQDDYDNVEEPFKAEEDETVGLTHQVLTNKEKYTADILFNTSVITNFDTPSVKFGVYSGSSDPLTYFKNAHNAVLTQCGVGPNAVIMSRKVANALMYHPQLKDVIGFKYNEAGLITDDQLKMIMKVQEILIADAPYNAAKEGKTDDLQQIWGDSILFYVKGQASKYQISLGYHMRKSSQANRQVFKYEMNNPPGSIGIIVQDNYEQFITNAKAGYLLNSVL